MRRTQEYTRKGIYVLWLLQWTPLLDGERYSPRLWEKWVHTAYFGRVYYWLNSLTVACYHFDPHLIPVPETVLLSPTGKPKIVGGYSKRSKRFRTATRGKTFNIVTDFKPNWRDGWAGGGLIVPRALIFMDDHFSSSSSTAIPKMTQSPQGEFKHQRRHIPRS
jgi:competence protein CoiA